MKNTKKFLALLCTMAMVMSLFSGVVLAAATTNVTTVVDTWASNVAAADTTLKVTVTDADAGDKVLWVQVDFADTGFVPKATQTATADWTTTVSGNVVTYVATAGGAQAPAFVVDVTNPRTIKTVDSGIVVKAATTADGAGANAVSPTGYSFKTAYKVEVTPESYVLGKTVDMTITATVDGVITVKNLYYEVKGANNAIVALGKSTTGGKFTIPVTLPTTPSQAYTVTVNEVSTLDSYGGTFTVTTGKAVTVDLTVNSYGTVYRDDTKTITGKAVDNLGKPIVGEQVALKAGGNVFAATTTNSNGEFTLVAFFGTVGDFEFLVGGATTGVKVTVKNINNLKVSVDSVNSPKISLDATQMDVLVTDNTSSKTPITNATVTVTYGDYSKAVTVNAAGVYTFNFGDLKKTDLTPLTKWEPGSYTVKATTAAGSETSITYVVANPAKLNVSASVGNGTDIYPALTEQDVKVTISDAKGYSVGNTHVDAQITKATYTVSGPVAKEVTYTSTEGQNNANPLTVKAVIEQAGTLTITGKVTYKDGSTETFTKTLTVSGYKVETAKTIGAVDEEVTLTATVTDKDGNPVNNAKVVWTAKNNAFSKKNTDGTFATATSSVDVNGQDVSINGGVYSKTVKLSDASDVTVQVFEKADSGKLRAAFNAVVEGRPIYTVTTDKANLVAGLEQTLVVTTTDANGNVVKPTKISVKSSLSTPGFTEITSGTWFDSNSDGTNDAFKFTFTPKKAETFNVVMATESGKNVGKTTVTVGAPSITAGDLKVTDSIKEEVTVSYNDGVTAGAYLKVTALGSTAKIYVGDATTATKELKAGESYEFGLATTHAFKVVATDDTANKTDAPELKLSVAYKKDSTDNPIYNEAGRMAILPVEIVTDKDEVSIGAPTAIVVTVKDAHGNAMADATVNATGVAMASGTTSTEGVTTLTVNAVSTGSIELTVKDAAIAKKVVKAVVDSTAPVITVDAVTTPVKTNTVTITGKVSDNVKVAEIYVNGAKVLFIPSADATFRAKVALEVGNNDIEVYAFDAAGNAATQIVSVEYKLPTVVKMTLGTTDVTKDGQALTGLDVPAQSIGGRTMLPLRFAFETLLGGTVDYNNGVITVTYNGKTAVMTVGSTTAMVDGQAMILLSAPVVQNNRALAPIREVLQAFGVTVGFDSATNSVTLSY